MFSEIFGHSPLLASYRVERHLAVTSRYLDEYFWFWNNQNSWSWTKDNRNIMRWHRADGFEVLVVVNTILCRNCMCASLHSITPSFIPYKVQMSCKKALTTHLRGQEKLNHGVFEGNWTKPSDALHFTLKLYSQKLFSGKIVPGDLWRHGGGLGKEMPYPINQRAQQFNLFSKHGNLVPRASFPLTSGRKTRALGATISGMRIACHWCSLRLRSEPDNQNSVISHCYFKTDAPRALVFRPLVKGNEALGTRLETWRPVGVMWAWCS